MAAPDVAVETDNSDEELIDRVRRGEEFAFQVLYDRYFRRVYHFLDKRLRNRADTEETTQEVFCNLFASIESYRGDAPFAAWVFGLTRRTLASRFKKKRHPTVSLIEPDGEPQRDSHMAAGPGLDPLAAYECRERISQMEAVMARELTHEQRKLFELHHLEHRSIQEIADALCKSEDAVKSNLYRTRKVLLAR